ncbi:uncharacterized protein LOC126904122 [Daktulosphaira vitifoliae]|uniref:uncharacterized protein LOC126904122 n=1 Tax=Daktulosphaira vitifoliae TaxID=58002 RepID=UPI0021A97941|nr:uncharacterized protein LOC126904122 [Daktulosphaira vitifoliae]
MFSLKLFMFIFLLLYVILYIKAHNSPESTIKQLDNLLKYPGWKNLNDVSSIKFCKKIQYVKNLIETPTHYYKGEQKIRALTIYLGCTYAKVMINIFSIIIKWQEICKNQNKEDDDLKNECIYTKELINIIAKLIVPIAILLKGALDALDLLHHFPWANFKMFRNKPYMIRLLFDRIGYILDELNDPSLSCDDTSTNSLTHEIVYKFFKSIIELLQVETGLFCEFVPSNTNYLWDEWVQAYRAINNQRVKLIFLKFLTIKIKDYIKTVILEKYCHLGFKFDPITEETFLPTPEEPIDLDLEFKAIDEERPTPVQI